MNMNRLLAFGIITATLPWGGFSFFGKAHIEQYAEHYSTQGEVPQQNVPASANTSYNWAGYVTMRGANEQFTSVTGTWTVPTVGAATSTEADTMWVGIGGVTSGDLIQAGTQTIADSSGGISYEAWYETLPQTTSPLNVTIHPGDSVTASLAQTAADEWQIVFRDNTTDASASINVAYHSSLSSAEWIAEMPLNENLFVPLDNFGSISFTNDTAVMNGNAVSVAGAGAQALTMVTNADHVLASPSPLGSDGMDFTVTRTAVSAGTTGRGFAVPSGMPWRRHVVGIEGYAPHRTITVYTGGGGDTTSVSSDDPARIVQMLQQMIANLQAQLNQLSKNGLDVSARLGTYVNTNLRFF